MHYFSAEGLTKSYGINPLFENISFHIEQNDKIALIARNGSGKSTLLKILAGKETPDHGKLWRHKDVDIAFFEQQPVFLEDRPVVDNIFEHDHPVINAIKEYEILVEENDPEKLNVAIIRMDELNAWDFDAKVKHVLLKLNIHHLQQPLNELSGGERKRVALAKTLLDIGFEHKHVFLIMDEPTNHLDVEMIEWMEYYLSNQNLTLLLVTHDRYFLDTVCKEIWEIENGKLLIYKSGYESYLEKKANRLESEAASIEKAKNTYRKELEWMRKQPRARTTKAKSRIDAFTEVEEKARQRIEERQMRLQVKMNRLGGKIIELKKLYKKYDNKIILKGFDYIFKKGERVGIIGKNGVGKSTFLNIIQQLEQPDSGKVIVGDTVIFGNYAQQGLQVKEDMRVIEYVKNIAENFPLQQGNFLSASQFLNLFLFSPEQQYTFISKLSGGEKRRLHLLSILFRNPNFLILDEPTNDLDLPTLNVLENFLADFRGCLLIVSHDRYFMDRLVDHLFIFEGNGVIRDFPGNYSQSRLYQEEEKLKDLIDTGIEKKSGKPSGKPSGEPNYMQTEKDVALKQGGRKLSYKEKREFEQLVKDIPELEKEKTTITEKMNSGNTSFEEVEQLAVRMNQVIRQLDEKELRWLELSEYEN